jgi:hypothetical protein
MMARMDEPRLRDLTAAHVYRLQLDDCMRYLSLAATSETTAPTSISEAFLQKYPNAFSSPLLKTKAAIPPGLTTDLPWGGHLLPPALLTALTGAIQAATVLNRIPNLQRAPLRVGVPIEIAHPSLGWRAENAPKPVSKLTLAAPALLPYSCGGIIVLSAELVQTPGAEGVMQKSLVAAAAQFVDLAFLDPANAPVAGLNPGSITNGITPTPAPPNVVDAPGVALGALFAQRPDSESPVVIMSPGSASRLAGSAHPDLRVDGGFVHGVPVVTSISAGAQIVAIDATGILYNDAGAEIDISREAAIQMDSAPTNPPVAATVIVSLWQLNLVGFRLDRFVSWLRTDATAVAYVTVTP